MIIFPGVCRVKKRRQLAPVASDGSKTGQEEGTEVDDLAIPLSHLELDLPAPAGTDWASYLRGQGVEVVLDDVGRPAIRRSDARRLFTEHRAAMERARELAERNAAELEARRLALLPTGIPASEIPAGLSPAMAMVAAGEGDRPRRRTSVLEDALSGDGITYRPIHEDAS
jgi:hypothetical protein